MPFAYPVLFLQHICTTWTKASRGGIHAHARSHTPEALLFPTFIPPQTNDTFFVHRVFYDEQNHFQQPEQHVEVKPFPHLFYYDCLQISLNNDELHIMLEWERSKGTPRRVSFLRTAYTLQTDQWMRLAYNTRIVNEESWEYKKYVFNLGLFSSPPSTTFLHTKPVHTYRDIAELW